MPKPKARIPREKFVAMLHPETHHGLGNHNCDFLLLTENGVIFQHDPQTRKWYRIDNIVETAITIRPT